MVLFEANGWNLKTKKIEIGGLPDKKVRPRREKKEKCSKSSRTRTNRTRTSI